ncbi:MAG: hypothetical protein SGPRY_008278 [Prymnesium sp.]
MRRRAPAPAAAQKKKRRVCDSRLCAAGAAEASRTTRRSLGVVQVVGTWRGKAAVKSGLFPGVTRDMIDKRLGSGQHTTLRDHHLQILTNDECKKLASWLLSCVDGAKPKDRKDITQKVYQILTARHKFNKKKRKYGPGSIPRNAREAEALLHSTRTMSCRTPSSRIGGLGVMGMESSWTLA